MKDINDTLVRAYRAAKYCVDANPPIELRVDALNADMDSLLQQTGKVCAAFITPENPFSQPLTWEENALRHQRFLADLAAQGVEFIAGYGVDDAEEWPREKSYLLLLQDAALADELAQQYGQNAYLRITRGRRVELVTSNNYHGEGR